MDTSSAGAACPNQVSKKTVDRKSWMLSGALAGLAGGSVFGAAMVELGVLDSIASVVREDDSVALGVIVHMSIAAVVGAGFGALVSRQRLDAGETIFWGVSYGALWWFAGPLTLRPLLVGEGITWDLPSAQAAFPPLLGHLLYEASTGLALLAVRRASLDWATLGALVRGALAGLAAGLIVGRLLDVQERLSMFSAMSEDASAGLAWLAMIAIAIGSGIAFALLVPRPRDSAGAALVRGSMFGFLLWVVLSRSLLPLIAGDGLSWSANDARTDFAALFAYILLGGAIGLGYQWLDALWRALFSDELPHEDHEGAGTQGLRAIGRGALAGVVGGLLFTYVMVEIGALEDVGNLARIESELAGIVVHFLIAVTWGGDVRAVVPAAELRPRVRDRLGCVIRLRRLGDRAKHADADPAWDDAQLDRRQRGRSDCEPRGAPCLWCGPRSDVFSRSTVFLDT